ncbi:hypothetical protein DAEQUDRAFT_692221 [Daedalea quercina L-15889]|uniref:Fungal-type protein kinase domain-containing protein n=1 Tax=Daedalea quercina L-15889 TaxID=1314783 RepID=A0A165PSB5_9APHY|nr:hypothetical protein DAEQUDRAFT_692221 [Daedalea quercina L-15889]
MFDSPPWMSDFTSPCSCGRCRALPNSSSSMTNTEHSKPRRRSLRGAEVTQEPERAARHSTTAAYHIRESRRKFHEYDGPVDEFIRKYARSSEHYQSLKNADSKTSKRIRSKPFLTLNKDEVARDEHRMYQPLVNAFTYLCKSLAADKRPVFYRGHDRHFLFPYKSGRPNHTYMSPDIVALPPFTALGSDGKPDRWEQVCFAIEVEGSSHDDPISSHSERAQIHKAQIMRDAGNMMLAHSLLCAFVVGIYGKEARIFRVDRAGAICSKRFNYVEEPEVLREFFWRFFRPKKNAPWIGADDMCRPASRADLDWAKGVCTTTGGAWDAEVEEVMNRWVKVPLTERGDDVSEDREYLTLRPIYIDPNTFCRATCVRQAVLKDDPSGKRYVVKDSWRQRARKYAEKDFYAAIEKYSTENNVPYIGIAKMTVGVDLGSQKHDAHKAKSQSANAKPRTPHSHTFRDPSHYYDRFHMRIVLDTVGIPLDEFPSTKVFIEAIRDAIKGHRLAFLAGVLHRDVSKGNILLLLGDAPFKGFICDFDYSSFVDSTVFGGVRPDGYTDEDAVEHDLKERTGTFRYFALELLNRREKIIHGVRHDLESFYWVILWIVLRHTDHTHEKGAAACRELFAAADEADAERRKITWLVSRPRSDVTILGNPPLTNLLGRLRRLVKECTLGGDDMAETPHLTHEAFLEILDDALKDERWPEGDKARKFVPPPDPEREQNAPAGSKRSRGRGDEGNRSQKKQKVSGKDDGQSTSNQARASNEGLPDFSEDSTSSGTV